jgi:acyl-CoA synthetase (NDP forming)
MSSRGVPAELRRADVRIPSYAFPEDAARALAHAVRYAAWRSAPEGTVPVMTDVLPDQAAALLAEALHRGPGWLRPAETFALLGCYGIPVAGWRFCPSPADAGAAAEALGDAVAIKAIAPTLLHKTEAGAVRLDLHGRAEVEAAALEMGASLAASGTPVEGYLVQRMVRDGVEMLVGMVQDESFGPVLACGAGGTMVEVIKDAALRLAPVTDRDAREMVTSLKMLPLLRGFRGRPPADVRALEDILLRVSQMVETHPEIAELDCNPVMVLPDGATVVDARVRVANPQPPTPLGARPRGRKS